MVYVVFLLQLRLTDTDSPTIIKKFVVKIH